MCIRDRNKSAADKALLASYVEQLNAQQEGLNLAYDEEGDYLNLNAEQMNESVSYTHLDVYKRQWQSSRRAGHDDRRAGAMLLRIGGSNVQAGSGRERKLWRSSGQ